MINFTEHGYTPNNFQTLVDSTKLSNALFIEEFGINRASFYNYKNGINNMQYKDWCGLVKKVYKYLNKESINY